MMRAHTYSPHTHTHTHTLTHTQRLYREPILNVSDHSSAVEETGLSPFFTQGAVQCFDFPCRRKYMCACLAQSLYIQLLLQQKRCRILLPGIIISSVLADGSTSHKKRVYWLLFFMNPGHWAYCLHTCIRQSIMICVVLKGGFVFN